MPSPVLADAVDTAAAAYRTSLGPTFESSAIAYATGKAHQLAGHPEAAWSTWVAALEAPSARGWPVMMNALVAVTLELGRVQQTVDHLARHADRLPELHLWVGVLASRVGDFSTAEVAFGHAEQRTTGELRFTATTERLQVLLALERLSEALAAVGTAIHQQPQHEVALRTSRAGVLNRSGRPADALTDLDRVLSIAPGFAPAWLNRGSALARLGRTKEAQDALAKAVQLDPTLAGPAAALAP